MTTIESPRELAIRLLETHKGELSVGFAKLATKLHPAWGAVEPAAFKRNAATLYACIAEFMKSGDIDQLLKMARDMMRIRKLAGFSSVDFNVLTHVYMPVTRKCFLARAPSVRQGLAAYDACEGVLLPMITRIIEASAKVDNITTPDAQPAFHGGRAFEELSLDDEMPEFMLPEFADLDEDEDEVTRPNTKPGGGRRRRSTRSSSSRD
jgi:hypothetical protein